MVLASTRRVLNNWWHNRTFAIWTCVVLSLLIRLGFSFASKTYQFDPSGDHWAYGFEWGRIAKWLVQTGMFSLDGKVHTADTDPLYIFLIAPFFYAFGIYTTKAAIALIVLQSIFCGITAWAVFAIAEKIYGPLEARLSALLFVFYPASVFFAVSRIGPSSLAGLLLCLIFLAALRLPSSRGIRVAIWTGMLIGLVILTSSDNLSLLLVVPLWLFLAGREKRVHRILKGTVVVIAAVLVLLPWSIRNSVVSGEATISKANLGYHLYVGNNPQATGFFYTSVPPELADGASPYSQAEYYEMAFSWIAQHPGEFLTLTLKRVWYFWYVIEGRGSSKELLQGWLMLVLLGLAAIGLLFHRSQSFQGASLLWIFVAIYPLVFYFTHASFYRHRYHIEPFVLILASRGLAYLWTSYRRNRGKLTDENAAVFVSTTNR